MEALLWHTVESNLLGENIGCLLVVERADDVVVVGMCSDPNPICHGDAAVRAWSVRHVSVSFNEALTCHIPVVLQAVDVLLEVSGDTRREEKTFPIVLAGENQSARATSKLLGDILLDGAHVSRELHDRK